MPKKPEDETPEEAAKRKAIQREHKRSQRHRDEGTKKREASAEAQKKSKSKVAAEGGPAVASSTIPAQTDSDTEKAKDNSGSHDKGERKRKRDLEDVEDEEPEASEPAVKKSKKKAHKQLKDVQERVIVKLEEPSVEEDKKPGKTKKSKKHRDFEKIKSDLDEVDETTRPPLRKPKGSGLFAKANGIHQMNGTADHHSTGVFSDELLTTHSPFVQRTTSFYVTLSPCANAFPLEGLCAEHISPLLLTYHPPLEGVLLSYANPRISEHPQASGSSAEKGTVLARSVDEYAFTYVWLTAEFLVFRPKRGTYLEGYVNLQNESILGVMCYNYFNVGIERARLPKEWRWIGDELGEERAQEGEGYIVDGKGVKVEGRVVFRVRDFEAVAGSETNAGSVQVLGTLLSDGDDRAVDDTERQSKLVR